MTICSFLAMLLVFLDIISLRRALWLSIWYHYTVTLFYFWVGEVYKLVFIFLFFLFCDCHLFCHHLLCCFALLSISVKLLSTSFQVLSQLHHRNLACGCRFFCYGFLNCSTNTWRSVEVRYFRYWNLILFIVYCLGKGFCVIMF